MVMVVDGGAGERISLLLLLSFLLTAVLLSEVDGRLLVI